MTTRVAAEWEQVRNRLEQEGRQVKCRRVYLAEARREREGPGECSGL